MAASAEDACVRNKRTVAMERYMDKVSWYDGRWAHCNEAEVLVQTKPRVVQTTTGRVGSKCLMYTSSGMAIETADFTVVEGGMFTMNTHDGPTVLNGKTRFAEVGSLRSNSSSLLLPSLISI